MGSGAHGPVDAGSVDDCLFNRTCVCAINCPSMNLIFIGVQCNCGGVPGACWYFDEGGEFRDFWSAGQCSVRNTGARDRGHLRWFGEGDRDR